MNGSRDDWRGRIWGTINKRPALFNGGLILISTGGQWRPVTTSENAAFTPDWEQTRDSEQWRGLHESVQRGHHHPRVLVAPYATVPPHTTM